MYSQSCLCCCREEAIIDIFERNTNSVANVFDVTLQVHSHAYVHPGAAENGLTSITMQAEPAAVACSGVLPAHMPYA